MDSEVLKAVLSYLAAHQGRVIGTCVGFIVGILWAILGWWRAAIFLFCLALGYFIGYRLDRKDSWREILERVFPPSE